MFDPVLVAQSWVSATKCGPLAKFCGLAFRTTFTTLGPLLNLEVFGTEM